MDSSQAAFFWPLGELHGFRWTFGFLILMLVKRAAYGGGLLWLVPAALGFDRAAAAAAD